ncbi:hypothetical protein V2J09_008686 [Rumex salicifolius]
MDSNKDEALKCVGIAKEAIASGNKDRALKFIRISQRLNSNLSVDQLIEACEKIGSAAHSPSENGIHCSGGSASTKAEGSSNVERSYTVENVQLIRQVNRNKDYYAILGVEKTCSMDEIKKAYRKLSLKVHPDKNKAPGAEDAFKKVSKAFKCLSGEDSRRHYDQVGLVDEYDHNQQHVGRRRRASTSNFYGDDFDPDEVFRAFFGQRNFQTSNVFRTRRTNTQQSNDGGTFNFMVLLQLVPFLLIMLLAYLPFSEPEYSLQKTYSYQIPRTTEKYGVEFFVKSVDFDNKYPVGSESRAKFEGSVVRDYKNVLGQYCHIELQRRQWSRNMPTPHCDKLDSFGLAISRESFRGGSSTSHFESGRKGQLMLMDSAPS